VRGAALPLSNPGGVEGGGGCGYRQEVGEGGRRAPVGRSASERGAPGRAILLKGRPPEPVGGVGEQGSRRAWRPAFLFLERVALRAGEGGCYLGLPPHGAPPSNPRRQPRWLSYLLGPRSGPVDFQGKSTRATSRSASATTTFLRAWHVLKSGLQAFCFREKSSVPPERWAKLSAAKGRAVARRLPAWRTNEGPGAAVRVTQRAKEKHRLEGRGGGRPLLNARQGARCPLPNARHNLPKS